MKKRLMAVLMVAAMTMSMFAGCGNSDSAKDASADAASADTAADSEAETADAGETTITPDRTVVIATSGAGEPYSLIADDGTWTGIDAEIWNEIAERTGWTIEVKQAAFDSVWGEIDTGRADVCANCWAVKEERTEKYYDTIPYYGDAQCVVVSEDNDTIYEFADLAGTKVGVTNGQASQTIIEEMAEQYGFEVTLYEDTSVGLKDLSLGRIDAFANTTTNINNYTHYNEGESFRFLDEDLTANNVAYFLAKTDEGKQLRDEINVVLQEMLDDGTIAAITEKWMFADMTQLIQE